MAPHPIIMQVLHDDRSSVLAAALTRRLLEQTWDSPSEEAAPMRRSLGGRVRAFLNLVFGLRQDQPTGTMI